METLRPAFTLKSSDFRKALDISAPTMNDIFKKAGISLEPDNGKRAGAKNIKPYQVRKILEMRGYQYPQKTQVIAFMICKGGTGKTTSSFFVSQRLASYGAKVLVIDADPQGNLTSAFSLQNYGIELSTETPVLVDVLNDEVKIEQALLPVTDFLHLLPSTPMNSTLDGRIREKYKNPSLALKSKLQPIAAKYDYILIDCAPALNLTNTAIVSASNIVVLPVNPDNFSMMGLQQTLEEVKTIEDDFNISIDTKVILTRFDAREFTSLRYLAEITDAYKDYLFETVIKTSADVKNVITKHDDLFSYSSSSAKEDYDSLTKEIMGLQNGLRRKSKKAPADRE
jgi:chromosome partitioning protein